MDAPAFTHKQRVAVRRLVLSRAADGAFAFTEDWTEQATVRATKRDLRPMGYWVVEFAHGGGLCVHQDQLRAVAA
jgi:hypothetical protein